MSTARPRNIPGACLLACFAPLLAPRTRTAGHCRRWRNYKGGEEEMYAQTANAHRELAFFLDVLRPVSIMTGRKLISRNKQKLKKYLNERNRIPL